MCSCSCACVEEIYIYIYIYIYTELLACDNRQREGIGGKVPQVLTNVLKSQGPGTCGGGVCSNGRTLQNDETKQGKTRVRLGVRANSAERTHSIVLREHILLC